MRLHHYGIVVRDLVGQLTVYENLFGARPASQVYDDPIQQARICFMAIPGSQVLVELISPYSPEAPVAAFLEQRGGGGLHHVCYMVEDIAAAIRAFSDKRSILVFGPNTAMAFGGRNIAFFYLRDRSLLEIVEGDLDADPISILAGDKGWPALEN